MTAIRAAFKAYRMHQVLIMPRFARLTIALGLATAVFPVDAEYYFNPRFLSNDLAESVDLSAFTKGREAPPGTYRVDIYLNDEFMTSRDITFIADDNNAELIPCLSTDLLVSLGIKKSALLDNKEHSAEKHVPDNSACTPLQDRLADASTEFDVGQQHLSLSVPQIYAQIGGKVLMTLKYGNKSVPFGAIVTHGENKNGSIVAENGQVYLTGLPQSGKLQVSWGKDKNSNCIVEYKLPEVSPGTLLNQQTAICR
ncbi:hypothetical protein PSI51_003706 [Escherichia coli]|nr:hypothetical protein [Escherichia coli]EKH4488608.1 hypothetical protein [Escherichia coli]EKL6870585.1 hypothetical protein [Escherichia coli]EMA2248725.1 hypothetical protein [Escherichia coli]